MYQDANPVPTGPLVNDSATALSGLVFNALNLSDYLVLTYHLSDTVFRAGVLLNIHSFIHSF